MSFLPTQIPGTKQTKTITTYGTYIHTYKYIYGKIIIIIQKKRNSKQKAYLFNILVKDYVVIVLIRV